MTDQSDLDRVRTLGRRMMDLTGNGPPTRGERLKQRFRMAPAHPSYSLCGSLFISSDAAGNSLSAIVATTRDKYGREKEVVQIITATGVESLENGTDGDYRAEFDAALFDIEPGLGWSGHTPAEVAKKIAVFGRHLHFHGEDGIYPYHQESDVLILSDDIKRVSTVIFLLRGILAYNGLSKPGQEIHFHSATPLAAPTVELIDIDGALAQGALDAIVLMQAPHLKIRVDGISLSITQHSFAVSLEHTSVAERLQYAKQIMDTFDERNIAHDILRISSDLQAAA